MAVLPLAAVDRSSSGTAARTPKYAGKSFQQQQQGCHFEIEPGTSLHFVEAKLAAAARLDATTVAVAGNHIVAGSCTVNRPAGAAALNTDFVLLKATFLVPAAAEGSLHHS